MVHQPHLNTRAVSLVMLAALAATGLWLLTPWNNLGGGGSSSGPGGSSGSGASPQASIHTTGASQIEVKDNVITRLIVPITADAPVRLPDSGGTLRAETSLSESAAAAVPGVYAVRRLDGNGDDSLDPGEHAELVVDLPSPSSVHPGNPLRLVIDTADGERLPIEDVVH